MRVVEYKTRCLMAQLTAVKLPRSIAGAKRGSIPCSGCGVSCGNRSTHCKSCGQLLRKRRPHDDQSDTTDPGDADDLISPDVTAVISNSMTNVERAYSVRIRENGPDYRYAYHLSELCS